MAGKRIPKRESSEMPGLASLEDPRELERIMARPNVPTARVPDPEGANAFLEGLVAGSFSDNDTYSAKAGQVVGGFIPGLGQAADVRDLGAAIDSGDALAIGAGAAGFVPGLDLLKMLFKRGGRKAAKSIDLDATNPGLPRNTNRGGTAPDTEVPENFAPELAPELSNMRALDPKEAYYRSLDTSDPADLDRLIDFVNDEIRQRQGPFPWEK